MEWELIGVYDSYFKAPELSGYIVLVEKNMIGAGYHEDIPEAIASQAKSGQILALCVKGEKADILRHLDESNDFNIVFDSEAVGFSGDGPQMGPRHGWAR